MSRRKLIVGFSIVMVLVIFGWGYKELKIKRISEVKRSNVGVLGSGVSGNVTGEEGGGKTDSLNKIREEEKEKKFNIVSNKNNFVFDEMLNRLLDCITDENMSDSEYYPKGEKLYWRIRSRILSGRISHDEVVRFVDYLLSIGNERASSMAVSLGVLSLDDKLLHIIYDMYISSDPYTQRFILDRLEEVHVYGKLDTVLQEIDNGKFDKQFSNYLVKGVLLNQPEPEVIMWLKEKILYNSSSKGSIDWLYMVNYIGKVDVRNVDYIIDITNLLEEKIDNPIATSGICVLGFKAVNVDVFLRLLNTMRDKTNISLKFASVAMNNSDIRAGVVDKIFFEKSLEGDKTLQNILLKALYNYYRKVGREDEFMNMLKKSSISFGTS